MGEDYDNERCKIAADMLNKEPEALEPDFVDKINEVNGLVNEACGGELRSRQVIAMIIVNFRDTH